MRYHSSYKTLTLSDDEQIYRALLENSRYYVLEILSNSKVHYFICSACPSGFVYWLSVGKCYKVINENLNWNDASKKCSSFAPGAQLVTIENKEQDDAVTGY